MHALLFEVLPTPEGRARYFEIAARLRPLLDENPGLLFIDRYESLTRPGLILSHSLWRDEASLARWRSNETHYGAQCIGRRQLFEDYRLRIGTVVEEWTPTSSHGAPVQIEGFEPFRSVYQPEESIAVGVLERRADFETVLARAGTAPNVSCVRAALVARDYGMHERGEAPQFLARE